MYYDVLILTIWNAGRDNSRMYIFETRPNNKIWWNEYDKFVLKHATLQPPRMKKVDSLLGTRYDILK